MMTPNSNPTPTIKAIFSAAAAMATYPALKEKKYEHISPNIAIMLQSLYVFSFQHHNRIH
jgi:hypothetical protein